MTKTSRKPKVARATEPNAGIRSKLQKRLVSLCKQFDKMVIDDIFLHLASQNSLAQDWSLSDPKTIRDKQRLKEISSAVLAAWRRDNAAFRADIEGYVDRNIASWTSKATTAARKLAVWVARTIAADVTASQRSAYVAAGLSPDIFKERWTVPVLRQHISQSAAQALPDLIKWSTELITRMALRDVERLQNLISEGLQKGQSVSEIRHFLSVTDGFSADRARNVAIDQTNKITQGIARANDSELGVTQGIWIHVPGQYTSRETHKAMHGKRFDLNRGLFDSEAGRYTFPSLEPFCRCTYRPVIPMDALGIKRND